jgi:hypothetical protein
VEFEHIQIEVMDQNNIETKKIIIEKLSKSKNISLEEANKLYENLENYCELIINYTLKNINEPE